MTRDELRAFIDKLHWQGRHQEEYIPSGIRDKIVEAALREPGEQWLALPHSEGWWWRWNETARAWEVRRVGYPADDYDVLMARDTSGGWISLANGRWVRCVPPASPTPAGEAETVTNRS